LQQALAGDIGTITVSYTTGLQQTVSHTGGQQAGL
jgi:hypothetical protein